MKNSDISQTVEQLLQELNFPDSGILPAIAQDYDSKDILMLAWMNREAIILTLQKGEVHYWSRSRQEIWHKGASSGHKQMLVEFRFDCDKDAILLQVKQIGPACHTNRQNCFFYALRNGKIEVIHHPNTI